VSGDQILLFDGMGQAFVGAATHGPSTTLAVYDMEKMVRLLRRRDRMTDEEAREYLDFNTIGAWMGPGTPLVLHRMPLSQFLEEQRQ